MMAIRVQRRAFIPRNIITGLTGSLDILGEAKAYLHIGRGAQLPRYDRSALAHLKKLRGEKLEQELMKFSEGIEVEYSSFFSLRGIPCIPGSSLKGVARSRLELSFHSVENLVPSCHIIASYPVKAKKHEHGWRHQLIWPSSLEDRGDSCKLIGKRTREEVCAVCNLFGAPGLASRVFFGNLICINPEERIEAIELDQHEKIIALKPGAIFRGEISFQSLKASELGLLFISLNLHKLSPILIGNSKYRLRTRVDGKKLKFGELMLTVERARFSPLSIKELKELGISDLHLQGESLKILINLFVSKALEEYGKWLKEVEEVLARDGIGE